jgi:hypothetical protein
MPRYFAFRPLLGVIAIVLIAGCGGGGSGSPSPPPPSATHFSVTAPATATAGTAVSFTVTARDASNNAVTSYSGTEHFTSTDGQAGLPVNSMLTNGTGTFQATLKSSGSQTITATDSVTTTITGTSNSISVSPRATLAIISPPPPSGVVDIPYGPSSVGTFNCIWNPVLGWHYACVPCTGQSCASLPACRQIPGQHCLLHETVYVGFALQAAGGLPPYAWALPPGSALPPGLQLSTSGLISGTPTAPGSYTVTVAVSDSTSPAAQATATYQNVVIAPPPPPVINPVNLLPIATLESPYVGFTFGAVGRFVQTTWTETGSLPTGMALSSAGILSGTPTPPAGLFPITVSVTNGAGKNSVAVTIQVLTQGFMPTGSMPTPRLQHSLTLLKTGEVLVAGGTASENLASAALSSAELYDTATGRFIPTANMTTARFWHTATLLPSGKVLVAGGRSPTAFAVATAEIYDPVSAAFTPIVSMGAARESASETLLQDGTGIIASGPDATGAGQASAELYDPTTGVFTPTGSMLLGRIGHRATLLNDGTVLITGGYQTTAEIYDPVSAKFKATGSPGPAYQGQTATLLQSGKVLVTGGEDSNGAVLATTEVFDPATGVFTGTGSMETAREYHTASLLGDGTVLLAAGDDASFKQLSAAEIFNPSNGSLTATADLTARRRLSVATVLTNGQVLVTGGDNDNGALTTAELYH